MGKDFKEKYEKVCMVKDRALSLVENQINGNIDAVDAKELGEVADIAKDMAELMKLCAEAEYYHKITEAMEKNSDPENAMYMEKYLPQSRYYSEPDYRHRGNEMYPDPRMDQGFRNRMYYTEPNGNMGDLNNGSNDMNRSGGRDMNEGRSGMTRKMYMEHKDHADANVKMQDLESYLHDLSDDINEMMAGMTSTERSQIKQKLTTLASKIQ